MKILAFTLLATGAVMLSYGNAPTKYIQGCENTGVGQTVCAVAEWDSKQMNFLTHHSPELNEVIAAGQVAPVAYNLYNIAHVRA